MTDRLNRGTRVTVVLQVVIVLVIAASFFGTLDNGWADLDDPGNFLSNPHYRGLELEHPLETVHIGAPKPQSEHRAGGVPRFYPLPGTGHVGQK